jgi:hypothetical protein
MGKKIELETGLRDWKAQGLAQALQREILSLPHGSLPLQLAATQGGVVQGGARAVSVLRIEHAGESLLAHVGVFFAETVGGCSCGDEPFTTNGYCELRIRILRGRTDAEVTLI